MALCGRQGGQLSDSTPQKPFDLKVLLLDMDGTLTSVLSPWQFVHQELDLWKPHGQSLLDLYLRREIGYVEFCQRDVDLWNTRGFGLDQVHEVLDQIPVPQTSITFMKAAHKAGVKLAIVSTGFTRTADRIRRLAGLEEHELFVAANELRQEADGTIKAVLRVGDGGEVPGKAFWASHIKHLFQVEKEHVGAVGDTSGDTPLFQASAHFTQVKGPQDLLSMDWLPFSCDEPA